MQAYVLKERTPIHMDYMTIRNAGDISGDDGGYMSHQWSVLGMQMSSKAIIIGGALAIVLIAALVAFALVRINAKEARKTEKSSIIFFSVVPAFVILVLYISMSSSALSSTYEDRYSPYEENAQTFTSSYGIDPKDVFVDKSDCDYTSCTFSRIFYGDFVGKDPNGKDRSTWLTNQDKDGMNHPVRITATTRKGIRHMTIRIEGDDHLYLYEGTGDTQKLIVPRGAES